MAELPKHQEYIIAVDKSTTKSGKDWWVREKPLIAPERVGNTVETFIDGKGAFADIAEKMRNARKYIYITDWMLTPTIRLVRNGPLKTINYHAKAGEKLSDIARAHHTTVAEIRRVNDPIVLTEDQDLYINTATTLIDPTNTSIYKGKKNERLDDISSHTHTEVDFIARNNPHMRVTIPLLSEQMGNESIIKVPFDPDTLLYILAEKAAEGVKVRILLWDSADKFKMQDNNDIEAERVLEDAHQNIRVLRHPNAVLWSHHQKTIVIDGEFAYLGGLDLCRGRWDDNTHPVVADPIYHEGLDFYNTRLETPDDPLHCKALSYTENTRQPWHDVHIRLEGPSVYDVETNFYQRWDDEDTWSFERDLSKKPNLRESNEGKQKVQILRSIDYASVNMHWEGKECSIYHGYINAIRNASHFIYIENQFFISNFGDSSGVHNKLADEIARRVDKAISEKKMFKIVIVTPAYPEGSVFSRNIFGDQIAGQLDLEFKSLGQPPGVHRKGTPDNVPNGLMDKIADSLTKYNVAKNTKDAWDNYIKDYVGVYCLRNHGKLPNGKTVHDLVYVHTKLMIIDDHVFIIGSANTNDRSMDGGRDTELVAMVEDDNKIKINIGGKETEARELAHNLRVSLWAEHLGLTEADYQNIKDPYEGFDLLRTQAEENKNIYEDVFQDLTSDKIPTLDDYKQKILHSEAKNPEKLAGIKGHITTFPLKWLGGDEHLKFKPSAPIALNENNIVRPDEILTKNEIG